MDGSLTEIPAEPPERAVLCVLGLFRLGLFQGKSHALDHHGGDIAETQRGFEAVPRADGVDRLVPVGLRAAAGVFQLCQCSVPMAQLCRPATQNIREVAPHERGETRIWVSDKLGSMTRTEPLQKRERS